MACRIRQVCIGQDTIDLLPSDKVYDEQQNIYTLLIGNNGCGKTRVLKAIASSVANNHQIFKYGKIVAHDFNELPARTVVVTNTIGDSYPQDNSSTEKFSNMSYVYLGSRTLSGGTAKKHLLERAIRIVLENKMTENDISIIKYLFDFVGYNMYVKIDYKFSKTFFKGSSLKCKYVTNDYTNLFGILNNHRQSNLFSNKDVNSIYVNLQNIDNCDYSGSLYGLFSSFDDYKEAIFALRREKLLMVKNAEVKLVNSDVPFNVDFSSSGEVNLLTNLMSLVMLIKDNSLILIDEPEISMHPEWQLKYMQLLKNIIKVHSGCHIILATHSPFFVSDLESESSTVVAMSKGDKSCEIKAKLLEYSPYAWSVENILLNVFNVPYTRNYYFAEKMQETLDLIGDHDRDENKLMDKIKYIKSVYANLSDSDPLKSVAKILVNYDDI